MRYGKYVKFQYLGNVDLARQYQGLARSKLGLLLNQTENNLGPERFSREFRLSNGARIIVDNLQAIPRITIDVRAITGELSTELTITGIVCQPCTDQAPYVAGVPPHTTWSGDNYIFDMQYEDYQRVILSYTERTDAFGDLITEIEPFYYRIENIPFEQDVHEVTHPKQVYWSIAPFVKTERGALTGIHTWWGVRPDGSDVILSFDLVTPHRYWSQPFAGADKLDPWYGYTLRNNPDNTYAQESDIVHVAREPVRPGALSIELRYDQNGQALGHFRNRNYMATEVVGPDIDQIGTATHDETLHAVMEHRYIIDNVYYKGRGIAKSFNQLTLDGNVDYDSIEANGYAIVYVAEVPYLVAVATYFTDIDSSSLIRAHIVVCAAAFPKVGETAYFKTLAVLKNLDGKAYFTPFLFSKSGLKAVSRRTPYDEDTDLPAQRCDVAINITHNGDNDKDNPLPADQVLSATVQWGPVAEGPKLESPKTSTRAFTEETYTWTAYSDTRTGECESVPDSYTNTPNSWNITWDKPTSEYVYYIYDFDDNDNLITAEIVYRESSNFSAVATMTFESETFQGCQDGTGTYTRPFYQILDETGHRTDTIEYMLIMEGITYPLGRTEKTLNWQLHWDKEDEKTYLIYNTFGQPYEEGHIVHLDLRNKLFIMTKDALDKGSVEAQADSTINSESADSSQHSANYKTYWSDGPIVRTTKVYKDGVELHSDISTGRPIRLSIAPNQIPFDVFDTSNEFEDRRYNPLYDSIGETTEVTEPYASNLHYGQTPYSNLPKTHVAGIVSEYKDVMVISMPRGCYYDKGWVTDGKQHVTITENVDLNYQIQVPGNNLSLTPLGVL